MQPIRHAVVGVAILLLAGQLHAESLGQALDERTIAERYKPLQEAFPLAPEVYQAHYGPRGRQGGSVFGVACDDRKAYRFASGMFDITGPAFDQEQAGYADNAQISEGLHNRQWARAFVIESLCNGRRVVLMSVDQGLMFHAAKQGALRLVAEDEQLAPFYDWANVLITPTHSHMTAAGQAHHDVYNFFAYGHDIQSHEALVSGIYMAIKRAHQNLQSAKPGRLLFNQGELLNTSIQRSLPAYLMNPEPERARWVDIKGQPVTINRNAVVLKFEGGGKPRGMLHWFPIHGTSMGQHIKLLSGDNKGYAAWRFERDFAVDYLNESQHFTAGFFQADEGDNSPNIHMGKLTEAEIQARDPGNPNWLTRGGGANDYESTLISGTKQYLNARSLYDAAGEALAGGVRYVHAFIDMYRADLEPERAARYPAALQTKFRRPASIEETFGTCEPAYGISFAGGAEDGRGPMSEGQTCAVLHNPGPESMQALFDKGMRDAQNGALPPGLFVAVGCNNAAYDQLGYACHAEKPIAVPMATSPFDPTQGLAARSVPLQLITIGNFAVIGLPFEVTTTSGRRIRDAVLAKLAPYGVDYAVISGLSNHYSHYLTTREEYASQQYEGASTIFGPWSQEVVVQELEKLADSLAADIAPTSAYLHNGGQPYETHATSFVHQANTSDGQHPAPAFGALVQAPADSYRTGEMVEVAFVARNPRNDFRQQDSYLVVERQKNKNRWTVVKTDNDWSTRYRFVPNQPDGSSRAQISWVIPPDAKPGVYRISYRWDAQASSTPAFRVTR